MSKKSPKTKHGLIFDGVAASAAIDSSGEILDIKGVDISEWEQGRGTVNYEHKGDQDAGSSFNDTIGRIIFSKKIFKEADCDNDRQRKYWRKVKLPYIYVQIELFDGEDHPGAKAAAAMMRHYHSRGLPIINRLSIEGTTIEKDGQKIKSSIARRIALTQKPCNRTCDTDIVADPVLEIERDSKSDPDPLKELLARKYENPMYSKLGGSMEVECNPMLDKKADLLKALTHLKEIRKALTAGSYDAAPGALTGGAALQVEDPYLKLWRLKNHAKAALRDWDRVGDFRKFIKHKLPEADDSFIDLFTNLVDDYEMKKARHDALRKSGDILTGLFRILTKDDSAAFGDASDEAFNSAHDLFEEPGRAFKPGLMTGIGSNIAGRKFRIVDETPEHFAVIPHEIGHKYTEHDVKLFRKDQAGSHYRIDEPYVPVQMHRLDSMEHGDMALNRGTEQHRLIHGADLTNTVDRPKHAHAESSRGHDASWKIMGAGKLAFVKPANKEEFNDARREAVYYNMAKVFGMQKYVPVTAVFKHPITGIDHAVSEAIYDPRHLEEEHLPILRKLSESGELYKMALMDSIMGNADRNDRNFLFTPGSDPEMRLIDHGRIFKVGPTYASAWPDFLTHPLASALGKPLRDLPNLPVHPATLQWLMDLKPEAVKAELEKQKVPEVYIKETLRRLLAHQKVVQHHKAPSLGDLMDAPYALRPRVSDPICPECGRPGVHFGHVGSKATG